MSRLYDSNMYRFNDAQPSYWEATAGSAEVASAKLETDESCDVAIIGGGYTGLSAAYHLARDYHVDVRVLEAGHIGWGASGRNGGFCSVGGSPLSMKSQLKTYGESNVRSFYQAQVAGVRLVADIIRAEKIDTPMQGDCELEVAHSPHVMAHMKAHAEKQFLLFGLDTKVLAPEQVRERHFDSSEQFGAVEIRPTFGLHPMRYVKGLAAAAVKAGAKLHTNSEVLSWDRDSQGHRLTTEGGSLRARRVIMATNGFMPEHLHQDFVGVPLPVISAIIVTRPLTNDELAAHHWKTENPSINSRELLNYFRLLPNKRFMFGGRGHSRGTAPGTQLVRARLQEQLLRQWPAWSEVSIDYFWHGLICMTRRLSTCIGRLTDDPSVFYGFGYHGNGVNSATWTGKQLADWLGESAVDDLRYPTTIPVMARGLSPAFPFAALRLKYLAMALAWKRMQDWRTSL